MADLEPDQQTAVEAAVFRRLVAHLQRETEVQNIDLMILAGFCRNCLSNWYADAARERGVDLDTGAAREIVYGMPYGDWKAAHQTPATPEQLAAMKARKSSH